MHAFVLLLLVSIFICFANFSNIINCPYGIPILHPLIHTGNSFLENPLTDFKAEDDCIQSMT